MHVYPVSMMRVPAMERPTLCVGPGVSNANLQLLDVQLFADKAAEWVLSSVCLGTVACLLFSGL